MNENNKNIDQIECNNCGELNAADANFCNSCGVKLSKVKIVKSKSDFTSKDVAAASENSKKNSKKNKGELKDAPKQLNVTKMIYLIIALVIVALVIVISSGTFDSPKAPAGSITQGGQAGVNQGNPHTHDELESFKEIDKLQKEVDANPQNMELLLRLSHLLNDNGIYEKAIENYELYLKNKPNIPDVLVDLGVCYYNIKDFENAIDRMSKAIKIEPKHQIAHFNLGIVNFASNNIDEAKEWWRKTIEIDASTSVGKKAQELLNTN